MKTEPIRIGLVDDHPVFRKGLIFFFEHNTGYRVTLEAGNGAELGAALTRENMPDVLLLDIYMPIMGGLPTMQWLHANFPNLPVIILTSCEIDLTMAKLYLLGARAILQKGGSEQELLKAIAKVTQDGYYYNDLASRRMLVQLYANGAKTEEFKPALTEKEESFIRFAGTEMTYVQIAARLNLSDRGVDKIRNRLFEKLGVQNRASLAIAAERNGLLN